MSENKFIQHLKGKDTAKSVLEIQNQATPTTFANMPAGTSDATVVYSDHRGNATAVLKGTDNWKLSNGTLVSATTVYGDGRDLTGSFLASGNTLWVNATYTFANPQVFTANTKWVLKLCGHSLDSTTYNDVPFSLVIKIGNSIVTKQFNIREEAFEFCKEFVIDFAESETATLHAEIGDTMTVQLLCGDASASATIYNGMSVLTALQRRVDGDAVASANYTFEELETEVINLIDYVDDTFLPLAGGTMTGDLAFQYSTSYPKLRIIQSGQNTNHLRFINNNNASQSLSMDLSQAAIHPLVTGRGHVGTSDIHFGDAHIDKIYTGVINNGYDISVPVTASADSFALESEITDINGKIPTQASSSNQLADKSFVNSSIATNTANFIGTFNSVADLEAYSGTVTNNDYAFVIGTDSAGNTVYNRYKYTTATTPASWMFEYALNNSSFTANQWASINSGVTSSDVALARSAVQPSGIGNGTITITQGGTTKGTFTTNQSGNTTIDLDAGGAGGYHPGILSWEWDDHLRDDVQWLRADTFSWQSGSVYEAAFNELFNDIYNYTTWYLEGEYLLRTYSPTPSVGDTAYLNSEPNPVPIGPVTAYDSVNNTITVNNKTYAYNSNSYVTPTSETVAGYTVSVYTGHSGRKITIPSYETAVSNIYSATGVAWYYIIDVPNKRFKLPRGKHSKYSETNQVTTTDTNYTAGSTPMRLGTVGTSTAINRGSANPIATYGDNGIGTNAAGGSWGSQHEKLAPINLIINNEQDTDQYKYLYFYVGEFTQTAIENTAGINAEDFNDKADTDFGNTNMIDYVVAKQDPSAGNGYTWYRKYASGWVEQGGILNAQTISAGYSASQTLTLPITMADANFTVTFGDVGGHQAFQSVTISRTTTGGTVYQMNRANSGSTSIQFSYVVSGMAA